MASSGNRTPCVVCLDWTWFPLLNVSAGDTSAESKEPNPEPAAAPAPAASATSNAVPVKVYPILARAWGKHIQLVTCVSAQPASNSIIVDDVKFVQFAGRANSFNEGVMGASNPRKQY